MDWRAYEIHENKVIANSNESTVLITNTLNIHMLYEGAKDIDILNDAIIVEMLYPPWLHFKNKV